MIIQFLLYILNVKNKRCRIGKNESFIDVENKDAIILNSSSAAFKKVSVDM